MAKSRTYSNDSYMTPYYKIWLGGKALSAYELTLVEEIVFEDNSTGSDMVSITIKDPDYVIIGDKRLLKNTKCKVDMGYKNNHKTIIDGYISVCDVDFPEEGFPTIVIHVMDKSQIMNRRERKKVYKNMTYVDIAKKLAQSHGLSFSGKATGGGAKKQESVTQSYETDISFLLGLANEIDYFVYVSGNTLYFRPQKEFMDKAPSYNLWYRKHPFDILSFRPRIVEADQLDEVEESDIDNKTKKTTTAKSTKG